MQARSGSNPTTVTITDTVTDTDPYAALFAHPFTAAMVELNEDVYDLTAVPDTDFAALMTWLYATGWGFATETRATIDLRPPVSVSAEARSRVWSWNPALYGPKPKTTIPRFCRDGETCPHKETTCHYVHGDTIQCVNEPCKYDAKCCASDKRATCIRMHASEGQVWSPLLFVTR